MLQTRLLTDLRVVTSRRPGVRPLVVYDTEMTERVNHSRLQRHLVSHLELQSLLFHLALRKTCLVTTWTSQIAIAKGNGRSQVCSLSDLGHYF
jgi:hypothetical protein